MCKANNKWIYTVLTLVVFLLGFLALGPLREKEPRKVDDSFYPPKVVPNNDITGPPTSYIDTHLYWNIIAGPVCKGDEVACGKTTKTCDDGTMYYVYEGHMAMNLYAMQWLGYTNFCGKKIIGMKTNCAELNVEKGLIRNDALSGTCYTDAAQTTPTGATACSGEACDTSTKCSALGGTHNWEATSDNPMLRKQCGVVEALYTSTILWALGMAVTGLAFVVSIISCCFEHSKVFLIIIGVMMFLAGIFLTAAVGLFDQKGFPKRFLEDYWMPNKCGADAVTLVGHTEDESTTMHELLCYKATAGFYAYIVLVVVPAWTACFTALKNACRDHKEDAPAHPAAPIDSDEELI